MFKDSTLRSLVPFICGALTLAALSTLMPHAPLHAVGTDSFDRLAICTGPLDSEVEAFYCLDSLTGDLKAAVISPHTHKFNFLFHANVLKDMQLDPAKNPRFLIVTGNASFRHTAGGVVPGRAIVYVAEAASGKAAAYAVPWPGGAEQIVAKVNAPLVPVDVWSFRSVAKRN